MEGVTLMLAPEAQQAPIGWEPVNSQIITANFTTKKDIIRCYGPINDAEEEKKDDFYQQLQDMIDKRRARDVTILMDDLNTKIGAENKAMKTSWGLLN
jgi:exonuclease III